MSNSWFKQIFLTLAASLVLSFDPSCVLAAAAEKDTEGMSVDDLYEQYRNAPEGSDEKAELYKMYLREYSKNNKTGDGSETYKTKYSNGGDDETASQNSGDAVKDAYEKYKEAPAGPEKDRLYKEYLKFYRESSNTAQVSKKEKADEKNNGGVTKYKYSGPKTDEKSSSEKKNNQNYTDLENARARSDEAYDRYRNAPDGSSEKREAYAEYQKAYREYLAKNSESKKTGTATNADPRNTRGQKPQGRERTEEPGRNYQTQGRMAAPGVSYLADTPNTPLPSVSGGGGGGNFFKKAFSKFELSTEKLIGAQTCAALELLYGVNKDADLNARLNRVATRIAAVSDRRDLDYKFKIMNMKEVNAFAVPGGTIYVTRALLDFTSSDSELAAVLAHEMGHQVGKHSIKAFEKAMLIDFFIKNSKMGAIKNNQQALEIANAFMSLKYSRANEMESDRYGFKYSTMAGYNPYGMVKFFEKLKNKYEPEKTPAFMRLLQTHPSTHDRLIEAQNMAAPYAKANPQWQNAYSMLPK